MFVLPRLKAPVRAGAYADDRVERVRVVDARPAAARAEAVKRRRELRFATRTRGRRSPRAARRRSTNRADRLVWFDSDRVLALVALPRERRPSGPGTKLAGF